MPTAFERALTAAQIVSVASASGGCTFAPDDAATSAGGQANVAGAGGALARGGSAGEGGRPPTASGGNGAAASAGAGASGAGGVGGVSGAGGLAGDPGGAGASGAGGAGGQAGASGAGGAGGQAGASGAGGGGGAPLLTGDPTNGATVYRATCGRSMCHGPERMGPNLAALVPLYDDARIATTIRNGVRGLGSSPGMPAQRQLTEQDIADVIAYLRSMYPRMP